MNTQTKSLLTLQVYTYLNCLPRWWDSVNPNTYMKNEVYFRNNKTPKKLLPSVTTQPHRRVITRKFPDKLTHFHHITYLELKNITKELTST